MKKLIALSCILGVVGCSSPSPEYLARKALLNDEIPISDPSVTDYVLCNAALRTIDGSKKSKQILNAIVQRKIEYKECISYIVQDFGGISNFCADLNRNYVRGESTVNGITLKDMKSIERDLSFDCNTRQYAEHYFSPSEQRARAESMKTWTEAAKTWGRVLGSKF